MDKEITDTVKLIIIEVLKKNTIDEYKDLVNSIIPDIKLDKLDNLKNSCNNILKLFNKSQSSFDTGSLSSSYGNEFNSQMTSLIKNYSSLLEEINTLMNVAQIKYNIVPAVQELFKLTYAKEMKLLISIVNKQINDIKDKMSFLQTPSINSLNAYVTYTTLNKLENLKDSSSGSSSRPLTFPNILYNVPNSISTSNSDRRTSSIDYWIYVGTYRNLQFSDIPYDKLYSCLMDLRLLNVCILCIGLMKMYITVLNKVKSINPALGHA